jgi:uncharacterized membrane protein YkvA (DUF1232 family)
MRENAETLLDGDPAEVERQVAEAERVAAAHPALLEAVGPLAAAVRSWQSGERSVARADIALALGALLYVAQPVDLTPDYLPNGLDDDVAVLQWVTKRLARG